MGIIFGAVIGIAIGYFFKPQLDGLVRKVAKKLSDRNDTDDKY